MLSGSQKEAITHGTGPLLVIAGPGSGKTHTITNRISYLIHTLDVPPEKILVITFTREAALSMRKRLQAQEESKGAFLPDVAFGTFHSVFYHILKHSGAIPNQALINDSQRADIAFYAITPYVDREISPDEKRELARGLLAAVSYYKNTGNMQASTLKAPLELREYFPELLKSYEKHKAKSGIEYDDMLFACLTLLQKDKEALGYWQKRFAHILVDEFQDINPLQYEILKLLGQTGGNIFAVGDDDQAIYGFRGAYPGLMKEFLRDHRGGGTVFLQENYRSSQPIVDCAARVIGENKERFDKRLRAVRGGRKEDVRILSFETGEAEYEYLTERLKEYEGEWDTCVVLFRTNMSMQEMAGRLRRKGIPCRMKGAGECRYEHFMVKDINAYMKVALGEGERRDFLRIMNRPFRQLRREAAGEWRGRTEGSERDERENISEYEKNWESLEAYYEREGACPGPGPILNNIRNMKRDMERLKGLSPYLALQFLFRRMGYDLYLRQKAGTDTEKKNEYQAMQEGLLKESRDFSDWPEWWGYQESRIREYRDEKKNIQENEGGGVRLMTVHGAKGLEFSHVFLPDVNEGVFPYGRLPDSQTVEEERRLLYVGMTRAKNTLEILCLTGTKDHPRYPSRFLKPILQTYRSSISSSTSSSNSAVSRNSSKASATFSYSASSSIKPS